MRFYLLVSIVLNAVLATAQPNLFPNQVSGSVGITGGQTARLNVVYPAIPGIALQQVCSATLTISDDQGNTLKSVSVAQLIEGHSVSVDLNADTDLVGKTRTQIHGSSAAPLGCQLITSLEIMDTLTQKTTVVVGALSFYTFNPTHAGR